MGATKHGRAVDGPYERQVEDGAHVVIDMTPETGDGWWDRVAVYTQRVSDYAGERYDWAQEKVQSWRGNVEPTQGPTMERQPHPFGDCILANDDQQLVDLYGCCGLHHGVSESFRGDPFCAGIARIVTFEGGAYDSSGTFAPVANNADGSKCGTDTRICSIWTSGRSSTTQKI